MKIAYAQTVITPSLARSVFLAGFGQNRRAQSVHDDLYARVLVLHGEQQTLALCALDLIGFFRHDVQDVIRKVQDAYHGVQVIIASTHTHHGPDSMGLWGPDSRTSGVDPEYLAWLKQRLAETICQAMANPPVEIAAIKATAVRVPGVVKNARNPEIKDDELTTVQFVDTSGRPIVTLLDFPCHPEVLWEGNPHITADYPGVLRREVENVTDAPCIFFSGALGGMMTPDVKEHSFEEAEAMGQTLAQAALAALDNTPEIPNPEISLKTTEIIIPLENVLFKLAFWRKLLPDTRDRQGRVHSEVTLVKLGPVWFAAIPGELLPALGLEIKARFRQAGAAFPAVIGLANDELGYILPEKDYRYPWNPFNPGAHYEETMSLGRKSGPGVMQAIAELLAL